MSNTIYHAIAFLLSIGVNTHLSWQSPGWGYANSAIVESSLSYLGVMNIRDGIPYSGWTLPEYAAIAATGTKFDIIVTSPEINLAGDLAQINQLVQAIPGSVTSVEGVNEFNLNSDFFYGVDSLNDPEWAQLFGPALYQAVTTDQFIAGVSVIAASMANAGTLQVQQEGNLSVFVDSSNWHV
jgi:hypothetical protein